MFAYLEKKCQLGSCAFYSLLKGFLILRLAVGHDNKSKILRFKLRDNEAIIAIFIDRCFIGATWRVLPWSKGFRYFYYL